mmetsp:Transcript_79033/g.198631  ORF Transcript_79033/g.198631 Transcript_79033/m.198631 type:complete len:277 (-) Transcript_79033:275-1105(-)
MMLLLLLLCFHMPPSQLFSLAEANHGRKGFCWRYCICFQCCPCCCSCCSIWRPRQRPRQFGPRSCSKAGYCRCCRRGWRLWWGLARCVKELRRRGADLVQQCHVGFRVLARWGSRLLRHQQGRPQGGSLHPRRLRALSTFEVSPSKRDVLCRRAVSTEICGRGVSRTDGIAILLVFLLSRPWSKRVAPRSLPRAAVLTIAAVLPRAAILPRAAGLARATVLPQAIVLPKAATTALAEVAGLPEALRKRLWPKRRAPTGLSSWRMHTLRLLPLAHIL